MMLFKILNLFIFSSIFPVDSSIKYPKSLTPFHNNLLKIDEVRYLKITNFYFIHGLNSLKGWCSITD